MRKINDRIMDNILNNLSLQYIYFKNNSDETII